MTAIEFNISKQYRLGLVSTERFARPQSLVVTKILRKELLLENWPVNDRASQPTATCMGIERY